MSAKLRNQLPSQEELNKAFDYNPDTGELRWKNSTGSVKAGKLAGTRTKGYMQVSYRGKKYYLHNIVWIMVKGSIATNKTVDHINHEKSDNRLSNLREETDANQGLHKLRPGFQRIEEREKWRATITIKGKQKWLGDYTTALQARLAYEKASVKRHPYIYQDHFLKAVDAIIAG